MGDPDMLEGAAVFLTLGALMGFAPNFCERVCRKSGGFVGSYAGRYTRVWGGVLLGVGGLLLLLWIASVWHG
jgi:hypothetical protein